MFELQKRMTMRQGLTCPRCGSAAVVPIAYGYPGIDLHESAMRGEVRLGGCCITGRDPDASCAICGDRFFTSAARGRRVGEVKVLTWNVNCWNPERTADKLALLEHLDWDIALLQEVKGAFARQLAAAPWMAADDSTRVVEGRALAGITRGTANGCAIAVRPPLSIESAEILPTDTAFDIPGPEDAVPQPSRAVAGRVRLGEHLLTVASFHAPNAAGREGSEDKGWKVARKLRSYVRLARWVESAPRPLVVGLDANSWETADPFEPTFADDDEQRLIHEFLYGVGAWGDHDLRDVAIESIRGDRVRRGAVVNLRPGGPLAVTYRRGSSNRPRSDRFDRILASADLTPIDVEHRYDDGIAAGSDHAAVLATVRL
jgi:exonuclease III